VSLWDLLLATPEGNLVAGMKWLQGPHTQRYPALFIRAPTTGAVGVDSDRAGGAQALSLEQLSVVFEPAMSGLAAAGGGGGQPGLAPRRPDTSTGVWTRTVGFYLPWE